MLKKGYDPTSPDDRDVYAREVALAYMKRFSGMVETACKGVDHMGIWS